MTETSRRTVLKLAVAGAAMAASTTSFLEVAFGQVGQGEMALAGGGTLIVQRARLGNWTAIVVDPRGNRITNATGIVVVENGRMIGLENGVVVDGVVRTDDWIQHTDVIVFVQHGDGAVMAANPVWARGPVLAGQRPLLERAIQLRGAE
jgi:hypothetical protein